MNIWLDLSNIILFVYMYTCIKIYSYKLYIGLCEFVNKFIKFQSITNLLIIY